MWIKPAFVLLVTCGASAALAFGVLSPDSLLRQSDADAARAGHYDQVCRAKDEVMQGVHIISSLPLDQCYKMEPATQMKGIWIDAFEGSVFFPGLTKRPPPEPSYEVHGHFDQKKFEQVRQRRIWLDVSRVEMPRNYRHRREGNAVLVEFIGRKTSYTGSYGHLGMFGNEIIVDKVISTKQLD